MPATLVSTLLMAQATALLSAGDAGQPTAIYFDAGLTRDGRFVVFDSFSSYVVPEQPSGARHVYVHDRANGATELLSKSGSGAPANTFATSPSISADGRYAAFVSTATNLDVVVDGVFFHAFVRDRVAQTIELVDQTPSGAAGGNSVEDVRIAEGGAHVAFTSLANDLVAGDAFAGRDAFLRDLLTQTTELVSISTGGAQGLGESHAAALTPDGRHVLFNSVAANLASGDLGSWSDAFLRDRTLGTTTLISVTAGGVSGDQASYGAALSSDARFVAFQSSASDLIAGDTNGKADVFVRDLQSGTTERVSVSSAGAQAALGAGGVGGLSDDGRFVAFTSQSNDLDPMHPGNSFQAYLRDRQLGATVLVSKNASGAVTFNAQPAVGLVDDGGQVAFTSDSAVVVAGASISKGLYVRDLVAQARFDLYCTPKQNSAGCVPTTSSVDLPYSSGALDGFVLFAGNVLPNKSGIFFWGSSAAQLPFGGGTLCVATPLVRTPVQSSGATGAGACSGRYTFHFSQAYMAAEGVSPGDTLFGQFWSRDPGFAPPNNVGLTGGMRFTIDV